MAKNGSSTALVKTQEFVALAQNRERIEKVLKANLGSATDLSAAALQRIRMPAGGALAWTIPTAGGEESAPQLDCVIVAHQPCRAYWPGEFSGASVPPECSSPDGVAGFGEPGGTCRTCPHAQWESADSGRGQACKAGWRLFILRPSAILPHALTLSPTSLRPFQAYMTSLTSAALPYYLAITRIALAKAHSAGGIAYSVATFQKVGEMDEADEGRIEQYAQMVAPFLASPVGAEDYAQEDGGIET